MPYGICIMSIEERDFLQVIRINVYPVHSLWYSLAWLGLARHICVEYHLIFVFISLFDRLASLASYFPETNINLSNSQVDSYVDTYIYVVYFRHV